jgi:hypothetical protein
VFITLPANKTLQFDATGTPTAGGILYGTGSMLAYSAVGNTGQFLKSNGNAAPTWVDGTSGGVSTISNGTSNVNIASSNGAVTIATNGTTAMTVDTSQNVGVGTTSPATKLQISSSTGPSNDDYGFIQANYTGSTTTINAGITVKNYQGTSQFMQWDVNGLRLGSRIKTNTGTGQVAFTYGNDSEAMRIDSSGNLLVGTTSISNARLVVYGNSTTAQTVYASSSNAIGINNTSGTATYNGLLFSNNGGSSFVASVQVLASSVVYNTSSDARLKLNVQDAAPALDLINSVQVRSFDWKNTGEHQRYGMVAQELQSVAPEFVNDQLDDDHTLGIDYSKMVPMLVSAIQELSAKNDALEARLAKLETVQ